MEGKLLEPSARQCKRWLEQPILSLQDFAVLKYTSYKRMAGKLLEPSAEQCKRLWLEQLILSLQDCAVLKYISYKGWRVSY